MSFKFMLMSYLPNSVLNSLKRLYYVRALRQFTEAEEPDLVVAKQLVRPGECALDVGANVGWYTKVLSEVVGPQGLIISLEPIPDTYAILSHCVGKLDLTNVRTLNCAASNSHGTVSMTVPQYEEGGFNYYQARLVASGGISSSAKGGERLQVYSNIPVRTLDEIVAGIAQPIALIKCDVEGHELSVLRGSQSILTQQKPAWLIEVSEDPDTAGTSGALLFEIMQTAGYEAWIYTDGQLRHRRPGDKSVNYFFLQARQEDLVRSLMAIPSEHGM